jgi:carboxymethylenebutenolidase
MTATRIEIATEDGPAPAFVFGDPSRPSVLLFIDGIGMRPAMHELGEHLGAAGYHVLMPDVFWRMGAYTAADPKTIMTDPAARSAWFGKVMATSNAANVMRDTRAYLAYLGDQPVGVTGYCMGGRLAIIAAETYPARVAAVAAYHPGGLVGDGPDSPHLAVGKITGRVYVGAAMEDASLTDAQRATFAAALAEAGVAHTVELYPCRHGWVPSDTVVHDAAGTARHWETLRALFAETIG